MIKQLLHIAFIVFPLLATAQVKDDKVEIWESEKDYLEYRKGEKYKGPDDWYGSYPATMDEDITSTYGTSTPSGSGYTPSGIQYSPQQLQQDREVNRGFNRGGSGNGDLPSDPEVDVPEPLDLPDIDAPDIDAPDIDIDPPKIPTSFWNVLLFILIFAVLVIVVWLIVRNRKPSNAALVVDSIDVENNWNPIVITKTELELKLEEALLNENYREGIRVYFTFILKELIRKRWIQWRREKTNYHYVLEMHKQPGSHQFNECVRIYDLVWYGEYKIDKDIYELLKPTLEQYYKSLEPLDE
ncbi:MAG: hypothetical protein QNK23_07745 [Crocinitomicaceae bacterium]|nr:hypothetical protein [Crocinitomicaceae bacterium]